MSEPSSELDLEWVADRLWSARTQQRVLEVDRIAEWAGRWSMAEAYVVQGHITRRRLERGERHVGWKLGYTSEAMRRQMSIGEPNYGPLTDAMMLENGAAVPATVMQPRVEPEIAVTLACDVEPGSSAAEIAASLDSARACLEVVDSVWSHYRFGIEHNTADGSSAAYVVLGAEIDRHDLASVAVTLRRNGEHLASATGAAASGHPLRGVGWLARELSATGRRLRAGEVVITGGLTLAVPLGEGDRIEAAFDEYTVASCYRQLLQEDRGKIVSGDPVP